MSLMLLTLSFRCCSWWIIKRKFGLLSSHYKKRWLCNPFLECLTWVRVKEEEQLWLEWLCTRERPTEGLCFPPKFLQTNFHHSRKTTPGMHLYRLWVSEYNVWMLWGKFSGGRYCFQVLTETKKKTRRWGWLAEAQNLLDQVKRKE